MATRDILYAAAGGSAAPTYIEDVFSTWLYTGNGSSQTITNGIDLAGKGGMVWTKARSVSRSNNIVDTVRGGDNMIYTDATDAQFSLSGLGFSSFSFGSSGYTASNAPVDAVNGATFASWTFRKQAKFFDVVTGTGGATFNHSLGVTPGMIIIKLTNGTSNWWTVHRSSNGYFRLDLNSAATSTGTPGIAASGAWVNANSTTFSTAQFVSSGESFVAYLFAHDAGGFGASGNENVISCGSFTTDGSGNATVSLGYEPQWILTKIASGFTSAWQIFDTMREISQTNSVWLNANGVGAESSGGGTPYIIPTATGFNAVNSFGYANSTYIYMAIRRGPMKTPTTATTVFNPVFGTTNLPAYSSPNFNSGIDCSISFYTPGYDDGTYAYPNFNSRLQGTGQVQSPNSRAEVGNGYNTWDFMNGYYSLSGVLNSNWGAWMFRRAPGFFDVVCYTGTGSGTPEIAHNLTVSPELIICKRRNSTSNWECANPIGSTNWYTEQLNSTAAAGGPYALATYTPFNATMFKPNVAFNADMNISGATYVAYLFATVAGVSKVGSYTGTGSTLNINAGLPTGARFVLIKRTDSTGDWWTWDTVRGMVAGTDPRIPLNAAVAQTNANWVYTATNGFQIVTSDATVNASGGTYIYLAIA